MRALILIFIRALSRFYGKKIKTHLYNTSSHQTMLRESSVMIVSITFMVLFIIFGLSLISEGKTASNLENAKLIGVGVGTSVGFYVIMKSVDRLLGGYMYKA